MIANYQALTSTALAVEERERERDAIVAATLLRELPDSPETAVMLEAAEKRLREAREAFGLALAHARIDLGL